MREVMEEELQEVMEEDVQKEDETEIHAPGLNMAEADADFVVAQAEEMVEQQVILDSIRDEAELEANRRLIRQRQAEADALFDELHAEITTVEAATKQPEGAEL